MSIEALRLPLTQFSCNLFQFNNEETRKEDDFDLMGRFCFGDASACNVAITYRLYLKDFSLFGNGIERLIQVLQEHKDLGRFSAGRP